MEYSFTKKLSLSFEEALVSVKEALAKEGYGILTEIDFAETLKKRLGVTHDKYVILGACNPEFAYGAIQAEKEIGLFLPCNIIVYNDEGIVHVSAIRPTVAMGMIQNKELSGIAEKAEKKLSSVLSDIK
ncbi:MAG TPA: DUF302 domain-containing protein [Candidatus Kaiserbacteria bacterium]|nr:DUF302 domain-containing protein [Candidatus Kaiserbacteria bacterium]